MDQKYSVIVSAFHGVAAIGEMVSQALGTMTLILTWLGEGPKSLSIERVMKHNKKGVDRVGLDMCQLELDGPKWRGYEPACADLMSAAKSGGPAWSK